MPTDAIVTGFLKSPALLERSLAPLRRLRQEGIIRAIHCVTWSSPELDAYAAPLQAMDDVTLTRVPPPDVSGGPALRGLNFQIQNLEAALGLLPDQDGLVLKWRPDFVAQEDFLRRKIVDFGRNCAVPQNVWQGVAMPPPAFREKIWIPWADSNQPFFYEDAVFLGHRRDVQKLVTPLSAADRELLNDPGCGSYAHVVRFGKIFAPAYPLFTNYLRRYRWFSHDLDYRRRFIPYALDNGFFWHMLVAHAWILHSQFHVDIGAPGELAFYANTVNRDTDWSRPETLRIANPYDDSAMWRGGTHPGTAFGSVRRAFGRLMDDAWHQAMFTQDLPDLPRAVLIQLMTHAAGCRDGRLKGIEAEFCRGAERLFHDPAALAG